MKDWLEFVSIIASFMTLIGFIAVFIRIGREKGINETVQKEMRKDIDENKNDINNLGQKVNSMQIENVKLISTLSSDLGWIKSSLSDIKSEISKKKE